MILMNQAGVSSMVYIILINESECNMVGHFTYRLYFHEPQASENIACK